MQFRGNAYTSEVSFRILEAVLLDRKISLDWEEGVERGHLEAKSSDGERFEGNYGYPGLDPTKRVEFTRFKAASGEVALIGTWSNSKNGNGGEWLFRLHPLERRHT